MVARKTLLNIYAERLLMFLAERHIDSLGTIERLIGEEFPFGSPLERIQIGKGLTFWGRPCCRITYIVNGEGVPIEIVFRPELGYSHIIVKTAVSLGGYMPLATDLHGNRIQSKILPTLDLEVLKREIERLRDY
ncbi:hypothetical protein HY500_00335 [Candidatus Woesearchaeota archaeon]|nr:hypothetical protein [Candidatus Woesearchaeota archaeon]